MEYSGADSAERTVRVAPLGNTEPLLRSMGYDPEPILNTVGMDFSDFLNLDHRIPYTRAARLLDHCARTTGFDHFGLLLGQCVPITDMGVPGLLAHSASNVNAALHDLVRHFNLHDQGGIATLNTRLRYTAVGYAVASADTVAVDQICDLCMAITCGMMRSFCGADWNPARVELTRKPPEDSQPYKDYFRAPVVFDSDRSAVVFANKWLDIPLVTADANYHEQFAADAQALRQSIPNSVSLEVRIALHSRLTHAAFGAATVADLIGVHERTLHRRLKDEGTSFRELLEETRRILSCNYLKGTTLSIRGIAHALGYGSTGAFDHAFKRWFGQSPRQWREWVGKEQASSTPGYGPAAM
ncbi:HTH-type transcriptional regulator VirS [Halioglobus japonicus]|nr:HTH-type transcriptional regulator VirS [Halioglobus japonicus]